MVKVLWRRTPEHLLYPCAYPYLRPFMRLYVYTSACFSVYILVQDRQKERSAALLAFREDRSVLHIACRSHPDIDPIHTYIDV